MLEFDEKYFNSTLDDNTSFYVFPVEQIRGIKNLLFYSLPERKEFYPEVSAFSTYFIEWYQNLFVNIFIGHWDVNFFHIIVLLKE